MEEEEEMGEEGCSLSHKLNITNEFTDEFYQWVNVVGNFVCKNDTSTYFFVFLFHHFSLQFPQYIEGIIMLVVNDGYKERIF
jgi:hypothetical protein